uniref:BHLH domain-containing protein n=1 Tax=Panagrellus redivivus TaxID=6233 RepID=A0A7E4VIP3_PANRE
MPFDTSGDEASIKTAITRHVKHLSGVLDAIPSHRIRFIPCIITLRRQKQHILSCLRIKNKQQKNIHAHGVRANENSENDAIIHDVDDLD